MGIGYPENDSGSRDSQCKDQTPIPGFTASQVSPLPRFCPFPDFTQPQNLSLPRFHPAADSKMKYSCTRSSPDLAPVQIQSVGDFFVPTDGQGGQVPGPTHFGDFFVPHVDQIPHVTRFHLTSKYFCTLHVLVHFSTLIRGITDWVTSKHHAEGSAPAGAQEQGSSILCARTDPNRAQAEVQ